jgi:hypothetical protein
MMMLTNSAGAALSSSKRSGIFSLARIAFKTARGFFSFF